MRMRPVEGPGACAKGQTVGDPSNDLSVGAVYERYRDRIFRHILHLVRDRSEAEDLTQETFLRVHRKLASLRDRDTLGMWLYRIATNVCYDRFRQSSYRHSVESLDNRSEDDGQVAQLADEDTPGLDQVLEQTEMSECVREYLDELSDDHRSAILLHDVQGLTNPEIAEMLGCSLATVKIRLHRARRKLQEALGNACSFSYDERGVFVCDRKARQA